MPDRRIKTGSAGSVAARLTIPIVLGYSAITLFLLLFWNIGVPWAGLPGRIPELRERYENTLSHVSENEAIRVERHIEALLTIAKIVSAVESSDRLLEGLAAARRGILGITVIRQQDGAVMASFPRGFSPSLPAAEKNPAPLFLKSEGEDLSATITEKYWKGSKEYLAVVEGRISRSDKEGFVDLLFHSDTASFIVDDEGQVVFRSTMSGMNEYQDLRRIGSSEILRTAAESHHVSTILREKTEKKFGMAASRIMLGDFGTKYYSVSLMASATRMYAASRDSFLMTAFVFLIAVGVGFLTLRRVSMTLSPIRRLREAMEGYLESRPYNLPADAVGEIGLITRVSGRLMSQASMWKETLEREVADKTNTLSVIAKVSRLFAEDETNFAFLVAAGLIRGSFKTHDAFIAFRESDGWSMAEAGRNDTVTLSESEWMQFCRDTGTGISRRPDEINKARDGIELVEGRIVAAFKAFGEIYAVLTLTGFQTKLTAQMDEGLSDLSEALSPIIAARYTRRKEEKERRKAEELLFNSEKRFRTFFDESPDMIYTSSVDDVITEINRAGVLFLGKKSPADVVGHPFKEFALNESDRSLFLERIRETGYILNYEIVLKKGADTELFGLETALARKGANNEIIEIQGIIRDIGDRIAGERDLWKANLELAEANLKLQQTQMLMVQQEKLAAIGQLAAGIAHEINNPLGFLKSNHTMLTRYVSEMKDAWAAVSECAVSEAKAIEEKKDLPFIFRELDSIIEESSDGYARIMRIIMNLKNFARTESDANFQLYDLNEGINSTLTVAWNEIKYVAEVEKYFGDIPQIMARGDEINQVILNILVNAAQAIQEQQRKERGKIVITTREKENGVICTIEDDGPGIPEKIRNRIFDPFFTTKERGKGTGLGLSISHDIVVQKHRGVLRVESEQGRGTRFIIELPVSSPQDGEDGGTDG